MGGSPPTKPVTSSREDVSLHKRGVLRSRIESAAPGRWVGTRAPSSERAMLVPRWFRDCIDMAMLVREPGVSIVTGEGTLNRTDRCRTKNPNTGHDLWCSRKQGPRRQRAAAGVTRGVPGRGSEVQPGSTHDLTAARSATGRTGCRPSIGCWWPVVARPSVGCAPRTGRRPPCTGCEGTGIGWCSSSV